VYVTDKTSQKTRKFQSIFSLEIDRT